MHPPPGNGNLHGSLPPPHQAMAWATMARARAVPHQAMATGKDKNKDRINYFFQCVSAFAGLSVLYYMYREFHTNKPRMAEEADFENTVKKFQSSRILEHTTKPLPTVLLRREMFEMQIFKELTNTTMHTIILTGARGVGKSTIAVAALKDKENGVVRIKVEGNDSIGDLCTKLLRQLNFTCPPQYSRVTLEQLLYRASKPPILVWDCDETYDETHLRELLSFCKSIGEEVHLAYNLVVISASVHKFKFDLHQYRCIPISVYEPNDEEMAEFVAKLFELKCPKADKDLIKKA